MEEILKYKDQYNINHRDKYKKTALMVAYDSGVPRRIIQLLLEADIDPSRIESPIT